MKRLAALATAAVLGLALPAHAVGYDRHMTIRKVKSRVQGAIHADVANCSADQPVRVQRKTPSGWKTIAKTRTNDEGRYRKRITFKENKKYRTVSPQNTVGGNTCLKVISERTVTG